MKKMKISDRRGLKESMFLCRFSPPVTSFITLLFLSVTMMANGDEAMPNGPRVSVPPAITTNTPSSNDTSDKTTMDVETLVDLIKERYSTISILTANFVQESFQVIMQETQLERGTITIGKPERMLWSYDEPQIKKVLLDGTFIWLYTQEDNHLYRERYDTYSQNLFYQLISGNIDLKDTFAMSLVHHTDSQNETQPPRVRQLTLVPRQTHPAIETITVSLDIESQLIIATIVSDHYGNTTRCTFSTYSINPTIPRDFFSLTIKPNPTLTDFTGQKLPDSVVKDNPNIHFIERAE